MPYRRHLFLAVLLAATSRLSADDSFRIAVFKAGATPAVGSLVAYGAAGSIQDPLTPLP